MNIYLIERFDGVGYEEYDSYVVQALNESNARKLSFDENISTIKLIGYNEEKIEKVILGSFIAG